MEGLEDVVKGGERGTVTGGGCTTLQHYAIAVGEADRLSLSSTLCMFTSCIYAN